MVRILIADDHQMARLAVSQLIEEADKNWKVCCEVGDGKSAVAKALELKPDLAMLDFAMPDLDGITAGQQIRAALPNTSVVVYTFMISPQLEAFVKSVGLQGVVAKADTRGLIAELRRVVTLTPIATSPAAN
jgi:DNA-binding NarL/FixJ family response regulator